MATQTCELSNIIVLQQNPHSDWFILGYYSSIMHTGREGPSQKQSKSNVLSELLTLRDPFLKQRGQKKKFCLTP